MGTWGTGISSNDTYSDVYGEFFDMYDEGLPVTEISTKLVSEFSETINDPDDANNFWFALGNAQWECKELDPEILTRIEKIVKSGGDLEVWRKLDASETDLKKRATVLEKFVAKLRSEKPKARRRKKRVIHQPIFEKGECLVFRLANGNYGGAVVLEAVPSVGFGLNLVATTRINQKACPTTAEFLGANVLVKNFAAWEDVPDIVWEYSTVFKKEGHLFESVGKITVKRSYYPDDHSNGFSFGGMWSSLIMAANLQFETEENRHERPNRLFKVKELIGKDRWKFL